MQKRKKNSKPNYRCQKCLVSHKDHKSFIKHIESRRHQIFKKLNIDLTKNYCDECRNMQFHFLNPISNIRNFGNTEEPNAGIEFMTEIKFPPNFKNTVSNESYPDAGQVESEIWLVYA